MVVCAIVQIRLGSTRLPKKVLLKISGKHVFALVLDRIKKIKSIDKIIVATTTETEDNELVEEIKKYDKFMAIYRGSKNDVLDRYYHAAKENNADVVVRLTGDNTLYDPDVSELIINKFLENNLDYCSNSIIRTFPVGLDTEVFSFNSLEKAWKNAKTQYEREHVTPYLKNSKIFNIMNVTNPIDLSNLRFTLDYPQDLEFIKKVYEAFYPRTIFLLSEILVLLKKKPALKEINKNCIQL
ncbi:MAG: glycosyltransferase family protein [archaeon]